MTKIVLIFSSITDLWEFKNTSNAGSVEIDTTKKSIAGDFTESDIELATTAFQARVEQDGRT